MGTLASELGSFAEDLAGAPRVYCDANLPVGLIRYMRERLRWDVFFVMEEDGLRRAPDVEHFRMAAQLRRTLLTLDRDYLDDGRFPPAEGTGVIVLSALDERQLERLLVQINRVLFGRNGDSAATAVNRGPDARVPLRGRKLLVHADWSGDI